MTWLHQSGWYNLRSEQVGERFSPAHDIDPIATYQHARGTRYQIELIGEHLRIAADIEHGQEIAWLHGLQRPLLRKQVNRVAIILAGSSPRVVCTISYRYPCKLVLRQ